VGDAAIAEILSKRNPITRKKVKITWLFMQAFIKSSINYGWRSFLSQLIKNVEIIG
jgi:hypothetical protein